MHFLKPLFVTLQLMLAAAAHPLAQDKIYLAKETKSAVIEDITAKFVTYSGSGKGASKAVATSSAILLFNKNGQFLIPGQLDFSNETTPLKIQNFISGTASLAKKQDEIYTITESRINTNIIKEDSKFIYTGEATDSKIDKRKIAAIIYQNGKHVVYNTLPVKKIAAILLANNAEPKVPKAHPTTKNTVANTQTTEPQQTPIKDTLKPAALLAQNNIQAAFETFSPGGSYKEFEEKAVKKTKDLNSYLKILCTKAYGYEEHNKALDQAVKLFISEDAVVNVSSINHDDIKTYKIRQYLLRIKSLNYDRVEVEWTNVQYVEKFKKGIDGNYYGTVTFEQVFRGFMDGRVVYEDITRKDGTVVLKAFEKVVDGNVSEIWDVLLSDIGIVYTKAQIKTP